jgi:hypothetical protein
MVTQKKHSMRRVFRDNGLSIALFMLFAMTLVGQSIAGWHDNNNVQAEHAAAAIGYGEYLHSNAFLEITMENWESEFLQMFIYVVFTIFLYQKGSAESKDPDGEENDQAVTQDSPGPVRKGGWQLALYKRSLSIAFLGIFLVTFYLHALGGVGEYNDEQLQHHGVAISLSAYFISSRFWLESLQNWQSEFLSLFSMVVLSIFLRQQDSSESKPVASPHSATGH